MSIRTQFVRRVAPGVARLLWLSGGVRANEAFRVTTGDVSVTCPLTIGGSFDALAGRTTFRGVLLAGTNRREVSR